MSSSTIHDDIETAMYVACLSCRPIYKS